MPDSHYDAIVVGGGHHGTIIAAYLGAAGLRTAVFERRGQLGGGLSSRNGPAPGFRMNICAHCLPRGQRRHHLRRRHELHRLFRLSGSRSGDGPAGIRARQRRQDLSSDPALFASRRGYLPRSARQIHEVLEAGFRQEPLHRSAALGHARPARSAARPAGDGNRAGLSVHDGAPARL